MFGVTFRLNAISGWITYTFQCWHFNGDPNLQRKCRLFSWNSCSFLKPSSSEQKCIIIKKNLNVFGFEDWPKMKVCKRWARKECQLVVSQWWPCEEKIELLKPQKSNTFPVHRVIGHNVLWTLMETKMRNMKIGISNGYYPFWQNELDAWIWWRQRWGWRWI